jgi:isopenicillin N synthase-like dioxygenase
MIVYSEPTTQGHIPVVNLGPSYSGSAKHKADVAAQIRSACSDTGFFYVSDHGVDAALVSAAFVQAQRFFDQPLNWKARWSKQAGSNGYEPLKTQRLDNASPADLKESFNFAAAAGPEAPDFTMNVWPSEFPDFQHPLEAYHRRMVALGLHISRLIALSLNLPEAFFDEALRRPTASLRLLRYPPQPESAQFNQIGAGAHTDFGWITLLAQDNCGGLEIENAAGQWIRAEPIPGTFVVNLGDLVARWTNDVYHSSLHRVMNNRSGNNRHSIVLFYNPSYSTRVECVPTCITPGQPAKYEPCIAGQYRIARNAASRQSS